MLLNLRTMIHDQPSCLLNKGDILKELSACIVHAPCFSLEIFTHVSHAYSFKHEDACE